MLQNAAHKVTILPEDEHNRILVNNVHPEDWQNPSPASRYNLVVIGAGTAGLVTAAAAAGLGGKVALIERHLMGGDCLNVGCVPSKGIISAAKAAEAARQARKFGVQGADNVTVDFAAAMERMRGVRAHISEVDSAKRFRDLGVDVFLGNASFSGPDTVQVGDTTLKFKKAVIASGARAVELPIPGLKDAGYLDNETIFSLTELPKRLAVIGAGPIGCEMAQTFRRFGSEVTLIHDHDHILDREDADAAEIVQQTFIKEGVRLVTKCKIDKVERAGNDRVIHFEAGGECSNIAVDEILVAVGRAPNVEGLELEKVGVEYNRRGVIVNDKLQTTNPRIYAAGDICMNWKFTHAADFAARIVIQNALFFGRKKLSALVMPWCTYTDPEIAHVGMYQHEAKEKGIEIDTYVQHMSDVDRALTDGETDGFVKVHCKKGTGTILGATIVAKRAGDMISELTLAITNNISLGSIANVIHPYPTQADAIRRLGDQYNRTRLTPTVQALFKRWLAWSR